MKNKILLLGLCAFASLRLCVNASASADYYDPRLTPGENVIQRIAELSSRPVEYAQAAPSAPVTISVGTNGQATASVPGQPPIPLPPLAASYFSNALVFDVGVLTLGIGQNVTVSSYLQGFYNFDQHFALGVCGEFGAVNTLDAGSAIFAVRKIFNDNMEGYAGPEVGYDFVGRHVRGGAVLGLRYIPFNEAVPNLATHIEADALIEGGQNKPATGVKAGLSYRF